MIKMKIDYLYELKSGVIVKVTNINTKFRYNVETLRIDNDNTITFTEDGRHSVKRISVIDVIKEIGHYKDYPEYFI